MPASKEGNPVLVLVMVLLMLLVLVAVIVVTRVVVTVVDVIVGSKGTNASGLKVTAPTETGLVVASLAPPIAATVESTSKPRKLDE